MSHWVFYSLLMCLLLPSVCALPRNVKDYLFVYDPIYDSEMVNNCTNVTYTEYCNKIGACEPGTHVMCMYYQTGQVMGPFCRAGRMIKLPQVIKTYILAVLDRVRTSVSSGTSVGLDGVLLPKAKNKLVPLKWDTDLALFAQVWANQCALTVEDKCRATTRFHNPGQVSGGAHFNYTKTNVDTSKKCINPEHVRETVDETIAYFQNYSKYVTSEMVLRSPTVHNSFLTIVDDKTTHVGCGMSAYNNYDWDSEDRDTTTFQLVCNFSHQPVVGEPVYETELSDETTPHNSTRTTNDKTSETTGSDEATDPTTPANGQPTNTSTTDHTTPSSATPPDHTTSNSDHRISNSTETDDDSCNESANCHAGGRGPAVLILPIVTVEDAPPEKYLQKLSLINQKLRGYSKKVLSSKNLIHNMNKPTIPKPQSSKKGSLFTRVPTFHLLSQNHTDKHDDNSQENFLLRKKLEALLKQVPKKDFSRLEEALKLLKVKRSRRVHQLSTDSSPVMKLNVYNEVNLTNAVVPKMQNFDVRLKNDAPVTTIDETDDELLSVAKCLLKEVNTKATRFSNGDKTKYPENTFQSRPSKVCENSIANAHNDARPVNTVLGKNENGNRGVKIQPQFDVPNIRKQIAIVHAKEKIIFDEKYSKVQKEAYLNLHRNGNSFNNYMKHSNGEEQAKKYGSKNVLDDSKLKRRMYLENEINKLKRKLQHLRQYIRRNDISENDRYRPLVEVQNRRRNIKIKDLQNFYMPDRAHSLHEF